MSFKFDVSRPAGSRVTEILVGGKPVDEKKIYTLATSDFLVTRGGDGYVMLQQATTLLKSDSAPKDSEVLEQAITSAPNKTIAPKLENRIVKLGATGGKAKLNCPL